MNEKVKHKLSRRTLVLIKLICVLFVLFLVVDSAQSFKTTKRTTITQKKNVSLQRTTPLFSTVKPVSKQKPQQNKQKPTRHSFKKPAQNSLKKPAQNSLKKPAQNSFKKPAQNSLKKPAQNSFQKQPQKQKVTQSASEKVFHNMTNVDKRKGSKGFLSKISEHAFPLISLGKVINFFPVGDEKECIPRKGSAVAAAGVCLNPYDCRQRDGRAAGDCAYGLGVCCVFEVSCGSTIRNNLTYFMSPGFPEVWPGESRCNVSVHKMHEGITQLRIDFIHFNIGQPNSSTGECDSDVLDLNIEGRSMKLCGQNHGQHMYYNFPTAASSRDSEGDLTGSSTSLNILAPLPGTARVWLLRLMQLPLAQAAPHDCMQYFTADNGTITTFNYASNGRHLANMAYRACVRRNVGRCAVQYSPCHQRAFRIGTPARFPAVLDPAMIYAGASGPASNGGPGTGFYGPQGSFVTGGPPMSSAVDEMADDGMEEAVDDEDAVAVEAEDPVDEAEVEGSGDDPSIVTPAPAKRRRGRQWKRWSPYAQHYIRLQGNREPHYYYGYGNYGVGLFGYGRLRCGDRVTVPCDNDNFIAGGPYGPGVCDPYHCGASFCPDTPPGECRVETTVIPFAVSFNFGPPVSKGNAEDNIGACLRYQQLACD